MGVGFEMLLSRLWTVDEILNYRQTTRLAQLLAVQSYKLIVWGGGESET